MRACIMLAGGIDGCPLLLRRPLPARTAREAVVSTSLSASVDSLPARSAASPSGSAAPARSAYMHVQPASQHTRRWGAGTERHAP